MNIPVPILLPHCTCDNLREPTETHGNPRKPTGLPTEIHGLAHGNPRACPREPTGLPTGTHGLTHGNPRAYPREPTGLPTGLPTGTHGLTHGLTREPTGTHELTHWTHGSHETYGI